VLLHRLLHGVADRTRVLAALGVTDGIEPGEAGVLGTLGQVLVGAAGLDRLGGPVRRSPAEDDEVDQRVAAQRLAPCTEAQAASPTAIRPGTTVSWLPFLRSTTSVRWLVGMPPML
jgi:hypothetical protein